MSVYKTQMNNIFFQLDGSQDWNVYLVVCINHTPACVPSLVAYQCIIASASLHLLESWINYDIRFRTLAVSDDTLGWDVCLGNMWLKCFASSGTQQTKRCPCLRCGATNHYPDHCIFSPTLHI